MSKRSSSKVAGRGQLDRPVRALNRRTQNPKGAGGVDELKRRLHEAEKLVAFYAGEGRQNRPDMIEWQRLANKKNRTKAETNRMGEIARAVMDEDLDAPERVEEIKSLRAQLVRTVEALQSVRKVLGPYLRKKWINGLTIIDSAIRVGGGGGFYKSSGARKRPNDPNSATPRERASDAQKETL